MDEILMCDGLNINCREALSVVLFIMPYKVYKILTCENTG